MVFVLCLVHCSLFRELNSGANDGVHLGVDNINVVRHVGRFLDGRTTSRPAELVKDGDLILLIERMLRLRGLDTVRISKVKGNADADFGCGRVPWWVIDARRNYSGVCDRWRPLVLSLHRFFIAIARAVVNHDGVFGTAVDPLVWSEGGAPKRRRVVHAVRDRAFLPGPPGSGALLLRLIFFVMILSYGLILLVCLLTGWLFSLLCTGLRMGRILESVVSLMLSCSFFMSYGLVKG